ncbi:hypothetical protein JTB14_003264 [Gonioctena quinquepunctata]|nr:hypothetical protein JTB14_003264 [Gonioctena quinquepunctata]
MQQHGFEHILSLHSFTGCDTTSATFGRSEVGFIKLYPKSGVSWGAAVIFYNPAFTHGEVEEAGKMCFLSKTDRPQPGSLPVVYEISGKY